MQKIDEVILKGTETDGHRNKGRHLALAEFVIVSGFIAFLFLADIIGFLSRADLIGIAMPLASSNFIYSGVSDYRHDRLGLCVRCTGIYIDRGCICAAVYYRLRLGRKNCAYRCFGGLSGDCSKLCSVARFARYF